MQTTYATRLRRARQHSGLSQAELARRLGIKPQAVQYLEDEENSARGSRHTGGFARACGVEPQWLETGAGEMLGKGVREPAAQYRIETPKAIAAAIGSLQPELRSALATIVNALRKTADGAPSYQLSPGEIAAGQPRARTKRARAAKN